MRRSGFDPALDSLGRGVERLAEVPVSIEMDGRVVSWTQPWEDVSWTDRLAQFTEFAPPGRLAELLRADGWIWDHAMLVSPAWMSPHVTLRWDEVVAAVPALEEIWDRPIE